MATDDKPATNKPIHNITFEELKHNIVNDTNKSVVKQYSPESSSTDTDDTDYYLINESMVGLITDLNKDFSLKGFFDTNVEYASLRKVIKDNVVIKKIKLENECGDDDCEYFDCD